jgi:hypothetical protein
MIKADERAICLASVKLLTDLNVEGEHKAIVCVNILNKKE